MANDLSAFNGQAWSKRLVTKLDQINVLKRLVNTDWEGELQNVGDTVQVRTPGNVTLGAWTKNGTISYADLTPTKEAFTVSDAQYFAFKVDDVDKAQNDLNAMDIYMRRAVVALSNTVESKIGSVYTSTASANQITGASSAAIALDSTTGNTGIYYNIAKLAEVLSVANVPEDGRWLLISPALRTLLWNDTAHFIRASDMGDATLKTGRFGDDGKGTKASDAPGFAGVILGFEVYCITHLPNASGAGYMLAGDRDSITYAAQINQVEALRLQTTFANAVRGLLLHDAKVFAENAKRLAYVKTSVF